MRKKTILYTYNIADKKITKTGQATVFHENGKFRLATTKYGTALCGVIDDKQSVLLMLLADGSGSVKERKAHIAEQLDILLESEEKCRIGSYCLTRSKLDSMLDIAMQYKEEIPVQLAIEDFLQQTTKEAL